MRGFWGEVHTKTPGLYQVPNWSYDKKTQKRGGNRGIRGSKGGGGLGGGG